MISYNKFLKNKLTFVQPSGFKINKNKLNKNLFDWQKVLVKWSLFKGRSAMFCDTGLGKTICQLSWADKICKKTKKNILIYAPLAVSHQTVREGKKFGIKVNRCDDKSDVKRGINITNYERLEKFDPNDFIGIVLDESGIIKNHTAKFRTKVIDSYIKTPYKLCCSATPSPNDYTELGNTAEFLGVMTRSEMLSMFFINDTKDTTANWRLKGHVKDNIFWQWLASWCVMIKKPSDIGFSDEGYILPKLNYHEHIIPYKGKNKNGQLFIDHARSLSEVRKSMRETLDQRCKKVSKLINKSDDIWVAWCNLNDEGDKLESLIDDAVQVAGSTKDDLKVKRIMDFIDGQTKCLVTKPKIAMYGLNLQNCHNVVITGLSHSFEAFYQLIRRFWRFGQKHEVNVHIVIGEREKHVLATVKRKEKQMAKMYDFMIIHMRELMKIEIKKTGRKKESYEANVKMELPKFLKEKK